MISMRYEKCITTVQYSAVQSRAVQFSAVQCSTVQYCIVQYSAVQCRTEFTDFMLWKLLKNLLSEHFSHTESRLIHRHTVHDLYITGAESGVVVLDETSRNIIRKTGRN